MAKTSLLSAFLVLSFINAVSAADVTIYYSPSCPHCHHARDFISNTLVYEYPEIKVTAVNVMEQENLPMFQEALQKCKFESGGVPVIVIGDKCEQGYADVMQDTLRGHVESDMTDEQKAAAAENKAAMATDAEKFKFEHSDRANAIVEYSATAAQESESAQSVKKNEDGSTIWFWVLLIVLVAGLGYVLVRKDNKK